MPRFSSYFGIDLTQYQLDFVDISNEYDTPVYVDPYAIEVQEDIWAAEASNYIRGFFESVLSALTEQDIGRANNLMSHLTEPQETFLGVSRGDPQGKGVGRGQSNKLLRAIRASKAYQTGLLSDLSDMSLYVEGIDRDKISDLTTNVIRKLLVEYTQQQCDLYNIPMRRYSGPPIWDNERHSWVSKYVDLPFIDEDPIILVPKYIVRRKLSLDSQEFYNKQITDYLVSEHLLAGSALVQTIKGKPKVFKKDVREANPKSKPFIVDMVLDHPELLEAFKEIARKHRALNSFDNEELSINTVASSLIEIFDEIPSGAAHADDYHHLVKGVITILFYPDLIQPHKEWEIHDGRKRIDIVYTNAAERGFFAQRRNDPMVNANTAIVECKNYSSDIANQEIDQLLGRFDNNRGKLGIISCRNIDNYDLLMRRLRDISSRSRGYILCITDEDFKSMLAAKASLNERAIGNILFSKYRSLLE